MNVANSEIRERINVREVYRYLGYGTGTPDERVKTLTECIIENLANVVKPRNIYKIYDCSTTESSVILTSGKTLSFESRNLAANVAQCTRVVLLAATLGIEADKLLQKYEVLNIAKAAIIQACGAACIEAYCNILQERICNACSVDGKRLYLRPRFSPGYGDLPLQAQKIIFEELECTKRIGLTLTDSLLMYPTKSVTAFIGLTANPQGCHINKCEICENTECEFRNSSF
ncbi:MAG: Vitamin B12 dependent methionine synthase activation subunit [Lachnospiraceae bacterium]|nr:Vitamin B12 dependent methionine synthase activation subunit [Lachnospiraceae bacterium]